MGRIISRYIITYLALMAVAVVAMLCYSLFSFSSEKVDLFFRWGWIWDNTAILFAYSSIALHTTAVLLVFSAYSDHDSTRSPSGKLHNLLGLLLVAFLVNTGVAFIISEAVVPGSVVRQENRVAKTRMEREYRQEAKRLEQMEDYQGALDALSRTVTLIPGRREEVKSKLDELMDIISRQDDRQGVEARVIQTENKSPKELLRLAREFEEGGDLFSAYYYGHLAYRIDPDQEEARTFSSAVWEKLKEHTNEGNSARETSLFRLKQRGATQLSQGDPLAAYFSFIAAREMAHSLFGDQDPDVEAYIARCRQEALSLVFFPSDVEMIKSYPGYYDLMFQNNQYTTDNEGVITEYVGLKKLIPDSPQPGQWMAEGIAVIGIANNEILYELTAELGKILPGIGPTDLEDEHLPSGRILLKGMAPERSRTPIYAPMIHRGKPINLLEGILPTSLTSLQLRSIVSDSSQGNSSSLFALWRSRRVLPTLGISTYTTELEILRRLLNPFSLILFATIAISVGWKNRQHRKQGRFKTCIAAVVLPFAINSIWVLWAEIVHLATRMTLVTFGFTVSMILLLVSQGLLYLFVLILTSVNLNDVW